MTALSPIKAPSFDELIHFYMTWSIAYLFTSTPAEASTRVAMPA
jgi:hypothetical protein